MDRNTLTRVAIGCVVLIAVAIASYVGGYRRGYNDNVGGYQPSDTIRIHTTDTCFLPSVPDTVVAVKWKVRKVPQYDTIHTTDSVWVVLPFEQHFARLDSVADVWYSGYEARIDSARVYKYITTEVVNYHHQVIEANNMVGANAGISDASLFYMHRIGKLWLGASAGYTYQGQPTARASIGFQF